MYCEKFGIDTTECNEEKCGCIGCYYYELEKEENRDDKNKG
jgi:hypothetical protein